MGRLMIDPAITRAFAWRDGESIAEDIKLHADRLMLAFTFCDLPRADRELQQIYELLEELDAVHTALCTMDGEA